MEFESINSERSQLNEAISVTEGKVEKLNCKRCNAPLIEVWVTRPGIPITSKIKAECPHCGSSSFPTKISGQFHLGHTDYTGMNDFQEEVGEKGGVIHQDIIVKTARTKEWKE